MEAIVILNRICRDEGACPSICERDQALKRFPVQQARGISPTGPIPAVPTEPFPNTIQKGGKTYFFFKTYTTRLTLERDAEALQNMGYKTYVDTRVHVDALYTYPNYRFEERG